MKKVVLYLAAIIPLLVLSVGILSMSRGDIKDIVICSTNEQSHYIPSGICEYYLLNFRLTSDDIQDLESGAGLAFLFDIRDEAKRSSLLKHFVSKGVSVNKPSGIDGYPPLHAAIIYNDPELVRFLLDNGANPNQKDENQNMTAKEFVDFLSQKKPSVDRSLVKELLSSRTVANKTDR